jgi:hypothetical protein
MICGWKSVKNHLPDPYEDVYAWVEYPSGIGRAEEIWRNDDGSWTVERGGKVTHWREMHRPPKQREPYAHSSSVIVRNHKLIDQNLCIRCGSVSGHEREPNKLHCETCLQYFRDRDAARKADRHAAK